MRYTFFVGSTTTHSAWNASDRTAILDMLDRLTGTEDNRPDNVTGVWEGHTERSAAYALEMANDADALRVAFALSALTGNDAILVTRKVAERENHPAFNSVRRFRVAREVRYFGNRTLYTYDGLAHCTDPAGWALTPDVRGPEVAYLVWADATVTPVSA